VRQNNRKLEHQQVGKEEFRQVFSSIYRTGSKACADGGDGAGGGFALWRILRPAGGDFRRAGSEKGRVYHNGQAHGGIRPRVRQREENGSERERKLMTYEAGRSRRHLSCEIMQMAEGGNESAGHRAAKAQRVFSVNGPEVLIEESAKAVLALRDGT